MITGTLTGRTAVGKKSSKAEKPAGPAFERVELQVPIGWTATVDEAAAAMGLSRAAYIRQAVARQMARDRKELEGNDKKEG